MKISATLISHFLYDFTCLHLCDFPDISVCLGFHVCNLALLHKPLHTKMLDCLLDCPRQSTTARRSMLAQHPISFVCFGAYMHTYKPSFLFQFYFNFLLLLLYLCRTLYSPFLCALILSLYSRPHSKYLLDCNFLYFGFFALFSSK